MPGFIRGSQRRTFSKAEITAAIVPYIADQVLAAVASEQDPFLIAQECPGDPAGHFPIRSGRDVVCAHDGCGKIFDRMGW